MQMFVCLLYMWAQVSRQKWMKKWFSSCATESFFHSFLSENLPPHITILCVRAFYRANFVCVWGLSNRDTESFFHSFLSEKQSPHITILCVWGLSTEQLNHFFIHFCLKTDPPYYNFFCVWGLSTELQHYFSIHFLCVEVSNRATESFFH